MFRLLSCAKPRVVLPHKFAISNKVNHNFRDYHQVPERGFYRLMPGFKLYVENTLNMNHVSNEYIQCCYHCVAIFYCSCRDLQAYIRPDSSLHAIADLISSLGCCVYRNCTQSHPSLHWLKLFNPTFITWQQTACI